MSIFDPVKRRMAKRKEKIIPTVDRDRYQLEGSFFDPEKLKTVEQRSRRESAITPAALPVSIDTDVTVLAPQRDPAKRQRIFVVAGSIVLFVFGLKTWGDVEWGIRQMLMVAGTASVLTYLGLMWAFRFDINRKGYTTVLPLPSLFVASFVLFTELYFFVRFERIYEALMFAILLAAFMGGLVVSFLTANILNVSTFKKIPLLQVAHTVSYVLTLFSVFFMAFFFMNLDWNIYITSAVLFVWYYLAVYLHLSHFEIKVRHVSWYTTGIAIISTLMAFVMMLWPVDTLFRVLIPTIVAYIGIGLVMHHVKEILRPLIHWEYLILAIIVFIVILLNSTWGIAGKAWM